MELDTGKGMYKKSIKVHDSRAVTLLFSHL